MATSGTNYTGKWTLSNGVLTLAPKSGSNGQFRSGYSILDYGNKLNEYITLTDEERLTVKSIVFTGSIYFYYNDSFMGDPNYVQAKGFYDFFEGYTNVETIDIRGIKNTNIVGCFGMFELRNLTSIIGLETLSIGNGADLRGMFEYSLLESLDLSTFPFNTAKNFGGIFAYMPYLHYVTLPSDMNRQSTGETWEGLEYHFGLAPATNANGITVRNNEDFFKLPEGQQGGLWTRDISGTAKLRFSVSGTTREANKATITYSYATSTATGSLYLKTSSESSFPSEPAETFTLTGTGTGSIEVTLPTDDSYDVWIVVTDGNETIYTYPSIDSNILLFKIKKDKTVEDGEGYSIPHIYVGQYNNWIYEHDVDSGLIKAWYDSGETTTTCTTSSGNGWYRNSDAYKISLAGLELDVVKYATITANAGYAYIVTSLTSVTTTELRYYVGHLGSYSNRSSRIYAEVVGYKFEEE